MHSSVRFKIVAVVFAVNALLVAFLTTYFPSRHIASVRAGLRDKATAYARLVAKQVEPGVAFDDRVTVREVFAATSADEDVHALALYDARGKALVVRGALPRQFSAPGSRGLEMSATDSAIRVVAPVTSREGPEGTLVVEVSTAKMTSESATIRRTAAAVGSGALALGFLAAWIIGRSFGRRIRAIAAATRTVAAGDLATLPLADDSADEIGQLARSFNAMAGSLRAFVEQIRTAGAEEAERLDRLVRARTAELDARNAAMRLVLDHVNQGLVVVEDSGTLSPERSAAADAWFGTPSAGATAWDWVGRLDPSAGTALRLAWEALRDGFMPVEVCVDQFPRRISDGAREIEAEYSPIFQGDVVARVLVVLSDVTRRREAERAEQAQREIASAFEQATRDRTGFLEFLDEASALVERVTAESRPAPADLRRWIHTLKGNASLAGLTRLASLCHELEDALAERGGDLLPTEREELAAAWRSFVTRLDGLLGGADGRRLTLDDADYESLLRALLEGTARSVIARTVAGWRLEPAHERLGRFGVQATALADRMQRSPVEVHVDGGGLRLSREVMAPVWGALAHALRNAVAHGLEGPDDREAVGKPRAGRISLVAVREAEEVRIEVEDDGRGIDWMGVRERARDAGAPCGTAEDLHEALFRDGLSTCGAVDAVSGRGIGMGALRAECRRLGGDVRVVSRAGEGTTVICSLPAARVGENAETRRVVAAVRRSELIARPSLAVASAVGAPGAPPAAS